MSIKIIADPLYFADCVYTELAMNAIPQAFKCHMTCYQPQAKISGL